MSALMFQSPHLPQPITLKVSMGEENAVAITVRTGESDDKALLEGVLTLIGPGEGWLNRNGRIIPFYATRKQEVLQVWLNGQVYEFTSIRPEDRRARAGKAARPTERLIKAPMPGTILKILVQSGDVVVTEQPLLVMESMKMEMTLSASHAAMVREVCFAEGTRVEMGTVLMELAPEQEQDAMSAGEAREEPA